MSHQVGIQAKRQGIRPTDWDLGQQTGIWANSLGFGPIGWDLGQQPGNWANRLGIGPTDWDLDLEDEIGALSPGGRDRWTDGWMYIMVHPCVLEDICPLGPLLKKGRLGEGGGWIYRGLEILPCVPQNIQT